MGSNMPRMAWKESVIERLGMRAWLPGGQFRLELEGRGKFWVVLEGGIDGGRVLGMEPHGKRKQCIRAEVPLAEVQRYAPDLQSITGGRGSFTLAFVRYDPVPAHLQEKIVAESKGSVAED